MEWSKPLREETLESKHQKIDISDITSILEIGIKNRYYSNLCGGNAKDISRGEKGEQKRPGGEGGAVESLEVGGGRRDAAVLLGIGA